MARGYLSGVMRRSAPEDIDTGNYVDRVGEVADEMPDRGRDLLDRVHGPAVRSITRSRRMRGVDDGEVPFGGFDERLNRILDGMRSAARQAGIDPGDIEQVLRYAEETDPTDSTMEAAEEIRRVRRSRQSIDAETPYPRQRR